MFAKRNKFSYETAENGAEALEKFKESCLPGPQTLPSVEGSKGKFDFVFMDLNMPIMNGLEATSAIREFESQNSLKRTTVIALTGLASGQAQKEAQMAGIDVFLPKVCLACVSRFRWALVCYVVELLTKYAH